MENLHEWSIRMAAARQMLIKLHDAVPLFTKGKRCLISPNKAEDEAIYKLLISDLKNIDKFLNDGDVWIKTIETDKKGRVTKCEAFFKEEKQARLVETATPTRN